MPEPGKCFIATAAYGSEWGNEVECLRSFRDNRLSNTVAGRKFILLYNRVGPIAARHIENKNNIRAIIRALLSPFIYFIKRGIL
jgi:hypothetical protein